MVDVINWSVEGDKLGVNGPFERVRFTRMTIRVPLVTNVHLKNYPKDHPKDHPKNVTKETKEKKDAGRNLE